MKKRMTLSLLAISAILLIVAIANPIYSFAFSDWKGGHQTGSTDVPFVPYKFDNGEVVYLDVKTGLKCSSYHSDNSKTGYNGLDATKTTANQNSCLKFYAFNDTQESKIVKLILDHNTTATINWSSKSYSSEGPNVVVEQLATDTADWSDKFLSPADYSLDQTGKISNAKYTIHYTTNARLITSQEIAQVAGDNSWHDVTATTSDSISFGSSYWLIDNIDDDIDGYWTSTAVSDDTARAWSVYNDGTFDFATIHYTQYNGVRPVIEVLKTSLTNFGSASENNGVTLVKGATDYVGPFSNSSSVALSSGIDEDAYIEIDPENIDNGESFVVTLGLKNSSEQFIDEVPVTIKKQSDKVTITSDKAADLNVEIKNKGIYTINWKLLENSGNPYAIIKVSQGDTKIKATENITMSSLASETGVEVSYLWFKNINVAKGINVYSSLPTVDVTFVTDLLDLGDPLTVYKYTNFSSSEVSEIKSDISLALKDSDLHYTLEGFYEDEDYLVEYDWTDPFTSDTDIYLKFEEIPKVKVSFDTSVISKPEDIEIYKGEKVTSNEVTALENSIKAAAAEKHYNFIGFYQEDSYENEFDFTAEINANTTVYIKLEEIPKVKVSFDTSVITKPEDIEIYKGEKVTSNEVTALENSIKAAAAEKHYNFIGFYQEDSYENEFDFTAEVNANTTVYIKLEEIPKVKVSFDTSLFEFNKSYELYKGDKIASETIESIVIQVSEAGNKLYYIFEGFYEDDKFETEVDFTKPFDNNTTVYLKFTEMPKVNVSFESSVISDIDNLALYKGNKIDSAKLDQIKENITKKAEDAGYIFEGLFLDKDFTNKLDITKEVNENIVVYLKLTKKTEEKEEEKEEEEIPEEKPQEEPKEEEKPKEDIPEEKDEPTSEKENNPKTFDNILLYVGIGIVSLIGIIFAVIFLKKKND